MFGCKSKKNPDDSSRRKRHRVTTDDRISDLADSILGNILSLLPSKDAVATGILSKRWKLLWTTTINLDFCFPKNYTGSIVQFYNFVNSVLGLHMPGYLNRFSLTWEKGFDPFIGSAWISAASARKVHELFVSVEMSKLPTKTQTCIFSIESLRSLELNCTQCISDDIVVSLPRLERLSLISVYFRSEFAFWKLLDGCSKLTYLVVHMDFGKMMRRGYMKKKVKGVAFECIVSSPLLTHLELLAYGKHPKRNGYRALCGVRLDAPSLRYISLQHQIYSLVVQTRLAVLDEANIHLTSLEHKTKVPNYCNPIVETLEVFGYATSLSLSGEVTRALSCGTVKMTASFDRLTRLEVSIDSKYWSSVQNFIELSDNLEFLIIKLVEVEVEDEDRDEDDSKDDSDSDSDTVDDFYDDSDSEDDSYSDDDSEGSEDEDVNMRDNDLKNSKWKKPNIVPKCLSNTLKRFSIGVFYGHHDELEMVSAYILEHGSVLQVMQIYLDESIIDSKKSFKLVQKISKFPKKSHVCEVEYCYGSSTMH